MKQFPTAKLVFVLFLAVVAFGVGVSAYSEPFATYPVNTVEPIDISRSNQAKVGGLSVYAFFARGNADFKKDLMIKGVAQGGNPPVLPATITTPTSITVASNVLTTGDLRATQYTATSGGYMSAKSLVHTKTSPQPVCADSNGIVVFCAGAGVPTPVPPDLCSNIPGSQTTLGTDVIVEDPTRPSQCTQIIRATIATGDYGNSVRNAANNAELGGLRISNITINSVGGVATNVWPSPIPLRFKWGYCSRWNTNGNYSGPTLNNGTVFSNIQNGTDNAGVQNGFCDSFATDYPFRSVLPRGFTGNSGGNMNTYRSVAWDGITQVSYPNGALAPKGFFDGNSYDRDGRKIYSKYDDVGYSLNLWYTKNHSNQDAYANIKRPVDLLVLYDMRVPTGYKLLLNSATPATTVETHSAPADYDSYAFRVNFPGFDNSVNSLTVKNIATGTDYRLNPTPTFASEVRYLPAGNYRISATQCQMPPYTGTVTNPTFTIPTTGGITRTLICP